MADAPPPGDFDPCACVCNPYGHAAMARLLRMIEDATGDSEQAPGLSLLTIVFVWLMFAAALFAMRPARSQAPALDGKPSRPSGGNPPPATGSA